MFTPKLKNHDSVYLRLKPQNGIIIVYTLFANKFIVREYSI